jgi:hypothetical protein
MIWLKRAVSRHNLKDTAIYFDVYVDNLDPDVDEKVLCMAFDRECKGCCGGYVMINSSTGQSREYGYVCFRYVCLGNTNTQL